MEPKTILLIDDNRSDEELTVRALEKTGLNLKIQVARDGEEGLGFLRAGIGHLPDLVLVDLKLPRVNGFEFLKRVRAGELARHLPIIVVSSSTKPEDVAEAYRLGCNAYVPKGVDYRAFAGMTKTLVEFWLVHNVVPVKEPV